MSEPPTLYVVAGPHGAGKSSYADALKPRWEVDVLDADEMSKLDERNASRKWLERCDERLKQHKSFCVESTLSELDAKDQPAYAHLMQHAHAEGYYVKLIYIALNTVAGHIGRVADRVAAGGRSVELELIVKSYETSLARLPDAIGYAHDVLLLDNSSKEHLFRRVVHACNLSISFVEDLPRWVEARSASIFGAISAWRIVSRGVVYERLSTRVGSQPVITAESR